MKSEEGVSNEMNVVMLGSPQKSILFEKLCQAADKYERHVHYPDVYYLTVNSNEKQETLEFTDPGLAHTGGREMAIRRADLALLFYSALSLNSLHHLQALKEDLVMKKNLPVRLVCDSDEVVEYEEDGESTGISSVSEGYESDPEREGRIRRRNSMDKIRKAHEDGGMAVEQGQQWAAEMGDSCEFITLSSSQFADGRQFLEEIVDAIRNSRRARSVSLIKRFRSRDKSLPRSTDKTSPRKITSPKISKGSRESSKSNGSSNSGDTGNTSKVCVIM